MTTVKEYLVLHRNDITCTKCGNCCSDRCKAKIPQNSKFICSVHPKTRGVANGSRGDFQKRAKYCALDPVGQALGLGIACPPVLEVVEKLVGEKIEKVSPYGNGLVFIEGHEKSLRYKKTHFEELLIKTI